MQTTEMKRDVYSKSQDGNCFITVSLYLSEAEGIIASRFTLVNSALVSESTGIHVYKMMYLPKELTAFFTGLGKSTPALSGLFLILF